MPALLLLAFALLGRLAHAADLPADAAPGVEDPRRLLDLGKAALAAGDTERAEALFTQRMDRMEVLRYLALRPTLHEAFLLEQMGDVEGSAERYRASIRENPFQTAVVLRILSEHPQREQLVAETEAYFREAAAAAQRGEKPLIYVTTKGEPRYLEKTTLDEVLARARKGEPSKYCYLDTLDFREVKDLPDSLVFDYCVVGSIRSPSVAFGKLVFQHGVVLGDTDLGKTFLGAKDRSGTEPPSTFRDVVFKETVFMGNANFAAIEVSSGRAYFPLTVFEGVADFKGAELHAVAEFRFASFGKGANFRFLRMYEPVYFGGSRYRDDMVFDDVYSERDVYFNEALFEGSATFFGCEFLRGATFENGRFRGVANFGNLQVKGNLNLSRAVFDHDVNVREVGVGSLDALGTHFLADASFEDAIVAGRTRFSLDEVTRASAAGDPDVVLPLYRHYQGDEDADEPITTHASYGVTSLDDLSARIDGDISFANTSFGGYTVFQGVTFGRPGADTTASFFNSQFQGESHFERSDWYARADFTTIFGSEVAFNGARFRRSLVLDDAAVSKRVTLTGATFDPAADVSFYGAEIASFQIDPDQVKGDGEPHRLFYERCTRGPVDRSDRRIGRILSEAGGELDDDGIRAACYDSVIDEFTALKASYGDRAMTIAEDDAWWWTRHHHALRDLWYGSPLVRLKTLFVSLLVFELCFGWGVKLGNLAVAGTAVSVLYAALYRVLCPDTEIHFDGKDLRIRDVGFLGLWYVSVQVMIAVNTGWDFGDDDHRFRILNLTETVIGLVMLTFFVGAYTRMILS